jgi:hypothetical protein
MLKISRPKIKQFWRVKPFGKLGHVQFKNPRIHENVAESVKTKIHEFTRIGIQIHTDFLSGLWYSLHSAVNVFLCPMVHLKIHLHYFVDAF